MKPSKQTLSHRKWRMLDDDEKGDSSGVVSLREIECKHDGIWDDSGWLGNFKSETYRTKLTREELSALRGFDSHSPQPPISGVTHPSHYNTTRFEVWDVLDAWFRDEPLLWQVGKYIARAKHKGNQLQDLEKAAAYLARKINQLKQSEPTT